jgi:hypothetical protein
MMTALILFIGLTLTMLTGLALAASSVEHVGRVRTSATAQEPR